MASEFFKVVAEGNGFLAVMPRPRSGDWLHDEIRSLSLSGVKTLASLLEPWEESELELDLERTTAESFGIEFLSFPIQDRSTPLDLVAFRAFVASLARRVRDGRGVAVHCRAGIGRSGITVAATLVALGYDRSSVFDLVSRARGFPVPDTEEQFIWFEQNWHTFGIDT